jgi:hypothetical protein
MKVVVSAALLIVIVSEPSDGSAKVVVARSEDNRTIRFHASAVREFVTHDGIFGDFEITFDENNKLIAIQSID